MNNTMHTPTKKSLRSNFLIWIILILTVYGQTSQGKTPPTITSHKIDYSDWKNAIELKNKDIRLVIIPSIGRIIHYSLLNENNLLYVNPETQGKYMTIIPSDSTPNIPVWGGDRVLPTSEEYFHLVNGNRSIPDRWIAGGPYTYKIIPNGIEIISPTSPKLGVRLCRRITIGTTGSQVKIEQILSRIRKPLKSSWDSIPITIWHLTQIRPPKHTWIPLNPKSIFKNGYTIPVWPDNENRASESITIREGKLALDPNKPFPQKVGADANGWVAGLVGNRLIIEHFPIIPGATYPDGGTTSTIFTCPAFTELESLSPQKILKPGEMIKHTIYWEIRKDTCPDLSNYPGLNDQDTPN